MSHTEYIILSAIAYCVLVTLFQQFFSFCTPQDCSGSVSHVVYFEGAMLCTCLWNHFRDSTRMEPMVSGIARTSPLLGHSMGTLRLYGAYGKAGNEMEMKWKLETETGNRNGNKRRTNHWFFIVCLLITLSILLSNRYGTGFMSHALPLLLYCAL